jgi:hypothetical protein
MSTTLSALRTRVRFKANMENSQFCTDAEINQYINDAYQGLYDILVGKFEDYYVTGPVTITLASGESTYTLPSGFYKLLGVDRSLGGDNYYPLTPFNFRNRNAVAVNNRRFGVVPYLQYRIVGDTLRFVPEDQAVGEFRIWYVPKATLMTADSDTIEGVNGWEEMVVIDAAIKCLIKEESDTNQLSLEREILRKRIDELALNRDAGEVQTIQDVSNGYTDDPLFIY